MSMLVDSHGPTVDDRDLKLNRSIGALPRLRSTTLPTMFNTPSLSKSPPPLRAADSPRSPALRFEEPPAEDPLKDEQQYPDEAAADDDIPYPEPSSEQTLLPPPNFRPFFALVEDPTAGEHYHPYVHYVFADDDPVIVTAASMRGMGLEDTQYLPHDTPQVQDDTDQVGEEEAGHDSPVESPLPPPIPGVREHYLIVDVAADGRTVVDAQSLSSTWQVTNASTRTAPSFDENAPDQGLMLRIEGVEIPGKKKGKGRGQPGDTILGEARERSRGDIFAALDGLIEGVEGSLIVAGKITSFGAREQEETTHADSEAVVGKKSTIEHPGLPLDFDRTG